MLPMDRKTLYLKRLRIEEHMCLTVSGAMKGA
jgi:hypothetical protein